ncbi:MAG: carbohydrate ABC transporter permease [Candidatus Wallbacteria bacterium]|nr:carbohydrate ABC transporter permease [Candidatus Wallbacteria bacterium]
MLGRGFVYSLLALWALLSLFPLAWMFLTAFVKPELVRTTAILPVSSWSDFSLENFRILWKHARMGRWFANTVAVCGVATVLHVLFDSMAGYAFARKEFAGRSFLFWLVLGTMMIPGQVLIVPMFLLMRNLGLIDTLAAVALPSLSSPFGIFMMRQFMLGLPRDLLDAARIDGASELGIYWRIVAPLAAPAMATLAIFVFMSSWNAFMWPLVVLFSADHYTLAVGLATLQGKHTVDYGLLMAGASVTAAPMIVAFLFMSRYVVRGLSAGALKG